MIAHLELKNFTAFQDLKIDFSPKINVIIGENATGKTHLLKAVYALCEANKGFADIQNRSDEEMGQALARTFRNVFCTVYGNLGNLHQRGADADAEVSFLSNGGHELGFSFTNRHSTSVNITKRLDYLKYSYHPAYIPAKEMMSFYTGLTDEHSDSDTLKRLFDATYFDLGQQLAKSSPEEIDNELNLDPRLGTVLPNITNAIRGKFVFRDEGIGFQPGHYKEKADGSGISFRCKRRDYVDPIDVLLTAEGVRKIGTIQRLLFNKTLVPGASGPLLWDEPEANMNPKLMKTVVEVLLELSRNGQQIILATHDYVMLKWFDLLLDEGKEDHIRYHSLYRDDAGTVKLHSTDDYDEIYPNPIDEAFGNLVDREIANDMGSLGK